MSKLMFKTPRGIAMYPYLNRPDTQFDTNGKYKVNLRMKKEDAKPLVDAVKKAAEEEFGAKAKSAKLPFKTDEDTGDLIVVTGSKFVPKMLDSQGLILTAYLCRNGVGAVKNTLLYIRI